MLEQCRLYIVVNSCHQLQVCMGFRMHASLSNTRFWKEMNLVSADCRANISGLLIIISGLQKVYNTNQIDCMSGGLVTVALGPNAKL